MSDLTRRSALTACLAAPAVLALARGAHAQQAAAQPLRVALIGAGWYGKVDLLRLLQVNAAEVVGLADPDANMLAGAAQIVASRQASGATPPTYRDYRELLAAQQPDLVVIGSPDHWHALHAIDSMEAGADVWVQKPTAVDAVECQAMVETARRLGRTVQVGLQRRGTPHLFDARDNVIAAGLLGDVGVAECYSYYHMRSRGNPEPQPVPEHLDWELWTGPAPMRAYTGAEHPGGWRSFMEYGNGIIGDMGVHMIDMTRWLLGLGSPISVSSSAANLYGTGISNISDTQIATIDFGPAKIIWQHRTWGAPADGDYPWGATLYGTEGTLRASVWRYDFQPRRGGDPINRDVVMELEQYPEDETEERLEKHTAPGIRWLMRDWLAAREEGRLPASDIQEGAISSVACILANVSAQLGRTLNWDAENWRVRDDDEANALLARAYRAPWVHPGA